MASDPYIFQRGEPVVIGDRLESGAVPAGYTMRARMKPVSGPHRGVMPGDGTAVVDPAFTTTFVAGTGGEQDSWLHSLTAVQSLLVAAGEYLADSTLLYNDVPVWTSDPCRIVMLEAASADV